MTNNNTDSDPDFCFPSSSLVPYHHPLTHQNQKPRKKRTKMIKIDSHFIPSGTSSSTTIGLSKPKYYGKKPDPFAPKITRPCTECGKKFWSWKALYGHMRCHPERQWRGINPPPNYRGPTFPVQRFTLATTCVEAAMTAEDHDVAAWLLLLANTNSAGDQTALETELGDYGGADGGGGAGIINSYQVQEEEEEEEEERGGGRGGGDCRFECSSCKKVFGSHQALGGHRASHNNVKGCFAIMRSDGCEVIEDHSGGTSGDHHAKENRVEENSTGNNKMVVVLGGGHGHHQCSICLRVFSSGQALGGHKRCHWEKGEEPSSSMTINQGLLNVIATKHSCGILDLNLPAPVVEEDSSSSYSSALSLDLRLCL